MKSTKPKPLPMTQPERGRWAWRDYLPSTLTELTALRERAMAAVDAGEIPVQVADGLVGWAWAEMSGESLKRGNSTESRYRRLLMELAPAPPRKRGRRARGDVGFVDVDAVSRDTKRTLATGAVKVLLDITGMPGDAGGGELVARRGGGEVVELYTRGEQLELVDVGAAYTRKAAA